MQDLETNLEFLLRPYQRALVDQWPRPTPAIMAPFFTGVNSIGSSLRTVSPEGLSTASIECGQPEQTRPFTPIGMANHAEVPSGLPIEDSGEEGSNGRPGKVGPVGGATAGG